MSITTITIMTMTTEKTTKATRQPYTLTELREVNGVKVKRCTRCHRELPLEAFARSATGRGGRTSVCRECMSRHKREKIERLKAQRAEAEHAEVRTAAHLPVHTPMDEAPLLVELAPVPEAVQQAEAAPAHKVDALMEAARREVAKCGVLGAAPAKPHGETGLVARMDAARAAAEAKAQPRPGSTAYMMEAYGRRKRLAEAEAAMRRLKVYSLDGIREMAEQLEQVYRLVLAAGVKTREGAHQALRRLDEELAAWEQGDGRSRYNSGIGSAQTAGDVSDSPAAASTIVIMTDRY